MTHAAAADGARLAAGVGADEALIDWPRVAELCDEVGTEDFGDVVELFLEEVEQVMQRLSGPSALHGLREDLHFLKGSALNLGFASFADLCARGERLADAGRPDAVDLAAVHSTYARSRAAG